MDVASVTFATGTALTSTALDAGFATLTAHQIVRADFASGFAWGQDVDLDGFGLLNARHINGTVADASKFREGDNSAAIQAAIDFVLDTSASGGIVYIPPTSRVGGWDIDETITVYSNITILGTAGTVFEKATANSNAVFRNNASATAAVSHLEICNLRILADGNSGAVVELGHGAEFISIHGITVGDGTAAECAPDHFVDLDAIGAGDAIEHIRIYDNVVEGPLLKLRSSGNGDFVGHVSVHNNVCNVLATSQAYAIDISSTNKGTGIRILDNWIHTGDLTSPLRVAAATPATLRHTNVQLLNNDFAGHEAGVYPVVFDGVDGLVMRGNRVMVDDGAAAGCAAIVWLSDCDAAIVEDNIISGDPGTASGLTADYGVKIDATCDGVRIVNNVFEDVYVATGAVISRNYGLKLGAYVIDVGADNVQTWGNHVVEQEEYAVTMGAGVAVATEAAPGICTTLTDSVRHALYKMRWFTESGAVASSQIVGGPAVGTDDQIDIAHEGVVTGNPLIVRLWVEV
ncbi:MAG: hypothetical protein GY838_13670 [bacterium]|nr:hypothetical protein [bacterium]